MNVTLEPLSNQHCDTGENPYWRPEDGCVYWTDIPAGKIYQYDPKTQRTVVCYRGDPVGGFTLQADGKFLLFRVKDIATLDPTLGHVEVVIKHENDDTMSRFNDVHADPMGRVYAGTMGNKGPTGGLYRVERDGTVTKLFAGTGCANGMAFTPDEQQLYWTDTSNRTIFRFRYHKQTGELTDRTAFYVCPKDEGWPDGVAMDEQGNLWSARWDGSRICLIDPTGKKYDEIQFPVKAVSSAIFGGVGNNEVFVTTAGGGKPTSAEADGTLYRIVTQTKGRPRFRSRIKLA